MSVGVRDRRWSDHIPATIFNPERRVSFPGASDAALASGVRELNGRHSALCLDERGDARKLIALSVVPQTETMPRDPPPRLDMGRLDANDPGAANRARSQMYKVPVIRDAVDGRVLAHRRHHDPVAHVDRAQRNRPE